MKAEQLGLVGESSKQAGMALAANSKQDRVQHGKAAMLQVLLRSPDGTATIDDATGDLAEPFADGGKWRGTVCRSLAVAKITERAGVEKSDRPSRHRGFVTRWRLIDRRKAGLLAAIDSRLTTAANLPKSKASTGATVEASVQQSFPQSKKGNENHGNTL